jgi:hypothetical protein
VQRESKFCFVLLVLLVGTECCIFDQFYHTFSCSAYCNIACSLARQPCPAALPDSLARQPCPAALPGSLATQPCPAALPGSLAQQSCPLALPSSLARKPCRNITSLITGRRPAELQAFLRPKAGMQHCILLPASAGNLVQAFTAIIKTLLF